MRRLFFTFALLFGLTACGGAESIMAPDEEVARARYVHAGPPMITLFTVVSNSNNAGGHAGLLINGSQRLLFDPAGTFYHPGLPEQNDVHYGMTERAVDFYIDYHARITWRVYRHDKIVSPAVAEKALQLAQGYGAVPKAFCTDAVTNILRQLPGFESVPNTMFPVTAMDAFKALPGVSEEVFYDDDPDNNRQILAPAI